jgi:Aspartyl protease/PDZ domain
MLILSALLAASIVNPLACSADQIYAKTYQATGGAGWAHIAETIANGTVSTSGLVGQYSAASDLIGGRSRVSETLGPQSLKSVYDGHDEWRQDYSGGVHALDSPNARAAAITAAYLRRSDFTRGAAGAVTRSCIGVRRENGRTFFVLRAAPAHGLPVVQWIDASTDLIDRTIATTPTSTVVTRETDYRQVGPVVLPFDILQTQIGDEADATDFRVASYNLDSGVDGAYYHRPPDPTDTEIAGNGPTTVPITVEGGDVIVYAKIDGKGPLPFILDTGGHAILTPETARDLGLRTAGAGSSGGGGAGRIGVSYTFVRRLSIGRVQIPNQPFLVIPYDNDFSDRGSKQPLAGILGLEIFERLAVRIDYARATMTLYPPATFRFAGAGVRVPIVFQDDMPLATASADSSPGLFGIDTGNGGSPIMFGPFLQAHGFLARYALGARATGSGTGGAVYSSTQVLAHLQFARRNFHDILTYFVIGQHGGSFSSTTEAGNLGYQILANFAPTFDYRRSVMYVSPTGGRPMPARGRAGLALSKLTHAVFSVVGVLPNSPASRAGIEVGDTISAIDGRRSSTLGDADVYAIVRQAVGTVLTLNVSRGSSTRIVHLMLRVIPVVKA